MECGMGTGPGPHVGEWLHSRLGTVTVELEILIRESIWHLCITETDLGAAFDEERKESHHQRNRGSAHAAARMRNVPPPSSSGVLLISNK